MNKAVAKATGGEVATYDSSEWEGLGTEGADAQDYAIPFIQIAQALSPQLEDGNAKYIAGLTANKLFNTVTGEIFGEGVRVIPVKYEKKYLEFVVRENGGGLVNVFDTYDPEVLARRDDKNRSIADNGNQIVETRGFYCMVEGSNGDWYPAIVSMKSTGIKKAKQWMSMINDVKWEKKDGSKFVAPMFARMYKLGVAKESSKGNTWGNYTVERLDNEPLWPGEAMFDTAHKFFKELGAGEHRVDYAQQEGATSEDDVAHQ